MADKLKAIHPQESFETSEVKALRVTDSLESMRLKEAAKVVYGRYAEALTR